MSHVIATWQHNHSLRKNSSICNWCFCTKGNRGTRPKKTLENLLCNSTCNLATNCIAILNVHDLLWMTVRRTKGALIKGSSPHSGQRWLEHVCSWAPAIQLALLSSRSLLYSTVVLETFRWLVLWKRAKLGVHCIFSDSSGVRTTATCQVLVFAIVLTTRCSSDQSFSNPLKTLTLLSIFPKR